MFEDHDPDKGRATTSQDIFAMSIRAGLAIAGPTGAILAEFLTNFIPGQRVDRLSDFVEKLADRITGLEDEMRTRLQDSPAFASLVEQASVAAVRSASAERRTDLASIVRHGLSQTDAAMIEEEALLALRERLNDAEVLILMSYGNFKGYFNDPEWSAFTAQHPALFDVHPPTGGSSPDDNRQWTMVEHYQRELANLGLLRDREGVVKSGREPNYEITDLGKLLLAAIGRYRDPFA